jgi:hypothetical protein
MAMATKGAAEEIETSPDWAVYSEPRSEVRDSDMDPWRFKMELAQQSGSEDEFRGSVLPVTGQQACACGWVGRQMAFNPETCTRKTVSRR